MKKEELELTRTNVTPAAFLAYVRSMIRKHDLTAISAGDIDLEYFRAGNDMNFDISGRRNPYTACMHERSVSKPYEMQTYVMNWDGSVYNHIMEFEFDDENTGHGYCYILNTMYTEDETAEAEAAAEENKKKAASAAIDQVSMSINFETEAAEIFEDDRKSLVIVLNKNTGFVDRGYFEGKPVYFVQYDYTNEAWVNVIVTPEELKAGLAASCFDHENHIQFGYFRPEESRRLTPAGTPVPVTDMESVKKNWFAASKMNYNRHAYYDKAEFWYDQNKDFVRAFAEYFGCGFWNLWSDLIDLYVAVNGL